MEGATPWLDTDFKNIVGDACITLEAAGHRPQCATLRSMRERCRPGGTPTLQATRQLRTLYVSSHCRRIDNKNMLWVSVPCARAVSLSADATAADVVVAFQDQSHLYFFSAAECKDKHSQLGKAELMKQETSVATTTQDVQGPAARAKSPQSSFVHVFDEAHVARTWHDFRRSFNSFQAFISGVPLHHLVCCSCYCWCGVGCGVGRVFVTF